MSSVNNNLGSKTTASARGRANRPTLMIIDDDDIDVRVIKRALVNQGIDSPVRVARDGIEALETLRRECSEKPPWPWVLLLDINMPRLNGHEFLEQLRKDPLLCDCVVFCLTTSSREQDIRQAYANKVAGYIVKSEAGIQLAHLGEMLRSYLGCVQFHQNETV